MLITGKKMEKKMEKKRHRIKERQTIIVEYLIESEGDEYARTGAHTVLEREEIDCSACEILEIEKL